MNKNNSEENFEKNIKKEFKTYSKDVLKKDVELYDDKPFIQKLVFVVLGISNFIVGYALYFLIKDDKSKKWQSSYLVKGSTIGLIISILGFIGTIVYNITKTTSEIKLW